METIRPAVTNEQPVLVRPSRDSDVEAMLTRREVTKLKAERDILKKAEAYFAKEAT